ncbi:MAG TPA: DUF2268 domain-containing putative Zn-dependent protease [Candidatus Angelobacter sp.]|nr:DUF2268 domain-containing putative Zn-dependent protease [Candidatus Angelobacter sp.]
MRRAHAPSIIAFAVFCLFPLCVRSQQSTARPDNHSPEAAVISTADIDLFWKAYDEWKTSAKGAPDRLAEILDRSYIQKGSPGVQAFIPARIVSAEALAKTILKDPQYYEAVRVNTLKMSNFVPEIRRGFLRLQEMFPDAVFPSVYFVVGRRNSGGTNKENGLIMGAEMFSDNNSLLHLAQVPSLVVHELVHHQQQAKSSDLLAYAMREGAADFIAELITGDEGDENLKSYGDSHEQELWKKFQDDARKTEIKSWLYNYSDEKRVGPADLGYYMGYKISQSFYQISLDKAAALRTIIAMKDPEAILEQSAYAHRFR